jgi:hypothetical protein
MAETLSQYDGFVWGFELLSFEIIWDFEIRVSGFHLVAVSHHSRG